MQIQHVFTVYDQAAGAYLQPFTFPTHGEAIRAFISAAMDPTHKFNRHGEDFSIFFLGTFDDNTAKFQLIEAPELLGRADIMAVHRRELLARHTETHKSTGEPKMEPENTSHKPADWKPENGS